MIALSSQAISMPTAPRLLIVDDDIHLARMLTEYLAGEAFISSHADNGATALRWLEARSFDLVILDVMMPQLGGMEVLRRVRLAGDTPVLMLTARGDEDDRVMGLELGADDYLSKPFSPRELVARVRAILRRQDPRDGSPEPEIEVGALTLDSRDMSVRLDGRDVRLTTAEFRVLETLARSPGRPLSRASLTQQGLGRPLEAFDRSIDTHVSNIRRKLAAGPGRSVEIRGVRGHGYLLSAAPSALGDDG
jgi:DNA-binding response OmpR family regulator